GGGDALDALHDAAPLGLVDGAADEGSVPADDEELHSKLGGRSSRQVPAMAGSSSPRTRRRATMVAIAANTSTTATFLMTVSLTPGLARAPLHDAGPPGLDRLGLDLSVDGGRQLALAGQATGDG